MRVKAAKLTEKRQTIEWRSHEPSRLETFSDAVFAFAVTLIIVSLEVPKTFTELYETMKGTISFAACFAVIFNIWNDQNIFFRRYGLKDNWTVALNGMLLFVVLVYAYPLKFLFGLLFYDNTFSQNGHSQEMIHAADTPVLMTIYGAGFTAIGLLFFLMYRNARKFAIELKLSPIEIFATNSYSYGNLISVVTGMVSIALAWLLPLHFSGCSGYVYMTLIISYTIWYRYRRLKMKRLFSN